MNKLAKCLLVFLGEVAGLMRLIKRFHGSVLSEFNKFVGKFLDLQADRLEGFGLAYSVIADAFGNAQCRDSKCKSLENIGLSISPNRSS